MHEANYCIRGSAMNNTTYKKNGFLTGRINRRDACFMRADRKLRSRPPGKENCFAHAHVRGTR